MKVRDTSRRPIGQPLIPFPAELLFLSSVFMPLSAPIIQALETSVTAHILFPSSSLLLCLPLHACRVPFVSLNSLPWGNVGTYHTAVALPSPSPHIFLQSQSLYPLLSTASFPVLFSAPPSPSSLLVKHLSKLRPCFVLNSSLNGMQELRKTWF